MHIVYGIGLLITIIGLILCGLELARLIIRDRRRNRRRNRRGGYLP